MNVPCYFVFWRGLEFARLPDSQRTKRQKNAFVIYVPHPSGRILYSRFCTYPYDTADNATLDIDENGVTPQN